MTRVQASDIEWPKWWPGHGAVAVVVWAWAIELLLKGVGLLPALSGVLGRLDAVEARPACTCVVQEHCDFSVPQDAGVGFVPPMGDDVQSADGRIEWERVDGRASK